MVDNGEALPLKLNHLQLIFRISRMQWHVDLEILCVLWTDDLI